MVMRDAQSDPTTYLSLSACHHQLVLYLSADAVRLPSGVSGEDGGLRGEHCKRWPLVGFLSVEDAGNELGAVGSRTEGSGL